ncbi:hypothetical protein ACFFX0_05505 [Citricoccus parietis]|uniref:Uncharacterized protein n=1 Tax=Citricoccus parietis TaxID=592307 RepID=A0ABV5FVG9_9MICC
MPPSKEFIPSVDRLLRTICSTRSGVAISSNATPWLAVELRGVTNRALRTLGTPAKTLAPANRPEGPGPLAKVRKNGPDVSIFPATRNVS